MEQPGVALSILLLAIVVAIVVGSLIISILRRIPGYRRARDQGLAAAADGERVKAEYAQAGLAVKSGFFSATERERHAVRHALQRIGSCRAAEQPATRRAFDAKPAARRILGAA